MSPTADDDGKKTEENAKVKFERKVIGFYELLGIVPPSDEQEIKKSYRRLALKWHPDKNPQNKEESERKFKKIAEAYEILTDKTKKSLYDKWGVDGLKYSGPPPNSRRKTKNQDDIFERPSFPRATDPFNFRFRSPFDVFRDFFGGRDPFQDLIFDDSFASFHSTSDPFEQFFAEPITRRKSQKMNHYQGGFDGFDHSFFVFSGNNDWTASENDCNFSSTIRFTTSNEPGENALTRKCSTSTKVVDGKKIVTKRTEQNGRETVEITENGVLTSRTIKIF